MNDYRMMPWPEPSEIGICYGCGEPILAGEEYAVFESGRKIHIDVDCKAAYVDRMLGIAGDRVTKAESIVRRSA